MESKSPIWGHCHVSRPLRRMSIILEGQVIPLTLGFCSTNTSLTETCSQSTGRGRGPRFSICVKIELWSDPFTHGALRHPEPCKDHTPLYPQQELCPTVTIFLAITGYPCSSSVGMLVSLNSFRVFAQVRVDLRK